MTPTLGDLIAGTRELSSLPSTTARLLGLLDDATAGAETVLVVIETDPSLTANLLKLCNSAYYGLRRQVATAREALLRLGNLTVINLAFAASMGDVLRGPLAAYRIGRDEMWHHALATALGAAFLAGRRGGAPLREKAFTGGLVHDIGKLLTNRVLREQLDQLPVDASAGDLLAAELKILGFDHAQAGAALAESWNFPTSLVRIIAAHHLPAGEDPAGPDLAGETRLLVECVAAANLIATSGGFGGGTAAVPDAVLPAVLAPLGVDEVALAELTARLPGDLDGMLGTIGERR